MAWEDRNGRMYYYRKRRKSRQVISEYIGNGFAGQLAEILDREERAEADQIRAMFRQQKANAEAIDTGMREIERYTKTITRAFLLLAGYHTHKRQWRKLRNV